MYNHWYITDHYWCVKSARAWKFCAEALGVGAIKHLWLWHVVNVTVTLQDQSLGSRVRLTHCNVKSMLSQFILSQIVKQTLCRLWHLKETKTAFVLLIESMVFSKQKCRSETNDSFLTGWDWKQLPNCHRKEVGLIQCKMHETVSKNKIGSTFIATNLHSRKVSYMSILRCFMELGDWNDFW